MINFSALPSFNKNLKQLNKRFHNIKNDVTSLINTLKDNPKSGIFIKQNIYKIRLKNSDTRSGKSGGYRILYYYLDSNNEIIFFTIFSKTELENISNNDLDNLLKEYNNLQDN
jgi:mRNA-degrading endonuclease RelE of RelBE toxin-antitoxin system